jgi:hypothetical protein
MNDEASEFGTEPSGFINCWETIEGANNYGSLRVVLSSIQLVS